MIIELRKRENPTDFENAIAQSRGFILKTFIDPMNGNFCLEIDDTKYAALTTAQKQAIRDKIQNMFPHMVLSIK